MSNKGNNGGKKVNNNAEISVKKNDKKLGEVTIDPKLKSELIDENVAEFKKKDLNAKENLKNKKEEVKKDVKSESLNKEDVSKNSNEDSKSKKDVSKGIKGIIVVIFIFLILLFYLLVSYLQALILHNHLSILLKNHQLLLLHIP